MITDALIRYLEDEQVSLTKKYKYIESLNLSYSDLFELKNIFVNNGKINRIIHSFLTYKDNSLENKIKKQDRKIEKTKKLKKIRDMRRRYIYD